MTEEDRQVEADPKNQYFSCSIILLTVSMGLGTIFGFSAIHLPQMEDEDIRLAKSEEASWIASVVNISQVLGSVLSGSLAGAIGRKKVVLLSNVFIIVGWAFIGFSDGDFALIITGRIIHGTAFLASVSQVYLAEVSDSKRRPILAGSGPLFVSSGITTVYVLGALLPWRWVCLACSGFPALGILLWKWLPETPTWLVHHGRMDEAKQTLQWLRGPHFDVSNELRSLESNNNARGSSQENQEKGGLTGLKQTMSSMSKPHSFKPFFLLLSTFTLQQATGTFAVIFYAVNVFRDAGISGNPYMAAIITGVIRTAGTCFGAILLPRFNRTIIMVISACVMALSMVALGATIQFKEVFISTANMSVDNSTEDENLSSIETALSVLPIIEIVIYMLSYGMGVGTVPWLLIGELCPIEVKGFASGVVACQASATTFVIVKVFPMMIEDLGAHGTYYFFAVICFVTAVVSYFLTPDTRGKSTAELQMLYQKKPKIDVMT